MPELFWVSADLPGRVAVALRPRGGNYLTGDMAYFRASGVDTLVSALGAKEVRDNWLEDAARHATDAGLEFVHFPIPNLLTPRYADALPQLQVLAGHVREGRGVAVHCFAGIGRSPTIAASILVLLGHEPALAWELVRAARQVELPDTNEQYNWVLGLPEFLRSLPPRSSSPVPISPEA